MNRGEIVEKFYPELEREFVTFAHRLARKTIRGHPIDPYEMVNKAVFAYLTKEGEPGLGHEDKEEFRKYMKAMIRNTVLNEIKHLSHSVVNDDLARAQYDRTPGPSEQAMHREWSAEFWQRVSALSKSDREFLKMVSDGGVTSTARKLLTTPSAVKWRMKLITKNLKNFLDPPSRG